jgi:hypothetical protein
MASFDPDFNKSLWLFFQQIKAKRQANTHGSIIRKSNTNFFDILFGKLARKRRVKYISTLQANQYRERDHARTDAWFIMVDIPLDANFRLSRHTFQFILDQIEDDIVHENTRLRKAVSPRCRLARLCTIWQALLNIAQLQICSEFPGHLFVFA